jgi:UDP-N-acetyl-D-mannosaminuronate dehydrogenase
VHAQRLDTFDATTLADFDAAVVVTNHRDVDYQTLIDAVGAVVDTRNALKGVASEKITKL